MKGILSSPMFLNNLIISREMAKEHKLESGFICWANSLGYHFNKPVLGASDSMCRHFQGIKMYDEYTGFYEGPEAEIISLTHIHTGSEVFPSVFDLLLNFKILNENYYMSQHLGKNSYINPVFCIGNAVNDQVLMFQINKRMRKHDPFDLLAKAVNRLYRIAYKKRQKIQWTSDSYEITVLWHAEHDKGGFSYPLFIVRSKKRIRMLLELLRIKFEITTISDFQTKVDTFNW